MGDARRRRQAGLPPRLKPQPEFAEAYFRKYCEISANDVKPIRLYRYRSCDTPFFASELEHMLLNNQIYLPSQPQLNDPFDCQPVFARGATFEEYAKYIHPVICAIRTEMAREYNIFSCSPKEMCTRIAENIVSEPLSIMSCQYEQKLDQMIAEMFNKIGILSLTTDNNNLVMWSMYASRGNGICVELEDLRLDVGNGYDVVPVQVRYAATRPKFDYWGAAALFLKMTIRAAQYVPVHSQQKFLESLDQLRYAWTKHERWRYEDEYRLIIYKDGGRYMDLPARVSALYIGDKVSSDTKQKIVMLVRRRSTSIPIYIASVSNTAYAMQFHRASGDTAIPPAFP